MEVLRIDENEGIRKDELKNREKIWNEERGINGEKKERLGKIKRIGGKVEKNMMKREEIRKELKKKIEKKVKEVKEIILWMRKNERSENL